jgi:hypothetical protein
MISEICGSDASQKLVFVSRWSGPGFLDPPTQIVEGIGSTSWWPLRPDTAFQTENPVASMLCQFI